MTEPNDTKRTFQPHGAKGERESEEVVRPEGGRGAHDVEREAGIGGEGAEGSAPQPAPDEPSLDDEYLPDPDLVVNTDRTKRGGRFGSR